MNTRSIALLGVALVFAAPATFSAGKPPGGGTTTTQILPTSLGTSVNCKGSYALAINNGGAYPLQVAAQGSGCTNLQPRALLWSQSTGMIDLGTIGGAGGGSAEGVSDNGTVAGFLGGGVGLAFVQAFGGVMQELDKGDGMVYAAAYGISQNGAYIVGDSSTDTTWQAVRWDLVNGQWRRTPIPSGGATAVSNSGSVVGSAGGQARVWTEQATTVLPGVDTRANDINAAGTVVVGFRWQKCPDPCGQYEVPMVWTLKNGTWTAQELQALDGVDSEATGVAEVNGQTVIVGYGYTRKDAIMRAVVWRSGADGKFGAPIRLAALNGKSNAWARATDVNNRGQVVGTSAGSGLTRYAVLWQLP